MRISTGRLLLGVLFSATALPAFADPITIISVRRTIALDITAGGDSHTEELRDQALLSDSLTATSGADTATASARLDTTQLLPNDFAVRGDTSIRHNSTAGTSGGFAQSTFAAEFDVNQPLQYSFGGTF